MKNSQRIVAFRFKLGQKRRKKEKQPKSQYFIIYLLSPEYLTSMPQPGVELAVTFYPKNLSINIISSTGIALLSLIVSFELIIFLYINFRLQRKHAPLHLTVLSY